VRKAFVRIVKNREQMLSHGCRKGRRIALEIIEHAIKAVDPYRKVMKLVRVESSRKLIVDKLTYDLSKIGDIYVVGAGKATFSIAKALEDILGQRLMKGVVIVKRGHGGKLGRTEVLEASHPIPDGASVKASRKIVNIAKQAKERDLVFCAITGGASALMSLPPGKITLEDKKKVTKLLLKSGATLYEINTVRKHISAIKGGKLAKYIHPAEIVNLIVIDEVEGLPWGPTVPDTTTFQDAARVLRKYNLWRAIPGSVKDYLSDGLRNPSLETPKPKDFTGLKVHNVVLADIRSVCQAAREKARSLGLNSMILSTRLEGESKEVGTVLGCIAKEIEERREILKPPCVLILGGETTVKLSKHWGKGGPSQEFALGSALKIGGSEKIIVASVDTDGTDGPTDIAGGIVDGYTLKRAGEKGLDIFTSLSEHNSSRVLRALDDAIMTGPTGTNVADLNIVVITA